MSNKGTQETMSKVLVLTGLPGSGKSVASEIAKSMNIPIIIMGNVIRRETAERGLEPNSINIGMVAMDLRKKFGDDVVIKKFEKTKGWLSQKLSSSNQIDQFANILDERSIWQRYGF